jgi:hypothetical protein
MATSNPYRGSNFDDLLKEDGIYEAVQTCALKREGRCTAESLCPSTPQHTSTGDAPPKGRCPGGAQPWHRLYREIVRVYEHEK